MASVIGTGSAALRKVIGDPFSRLKRIALSDDDDGSPATLDSAAIGSIIEGEIIPRLLMAHTPEKTSPAKGSKSEIDPFDASHFATLPLHAEAADLLDIVQAHLDKGVSVEAIYVDLLAPAARKLGELWEADECDFVDVTMGLWRLQEVMREVAHRCPPLVAAVSGERRILVAPMPGDQHSFGPIMVEDMFARSGWASEVLVEPSRGDLLRRMAERPFDVAALTITRDCPSSAIAQIINAMRSVAANPHMQIMIGGRVVNENTDLVSEVGADGTALDARAAVNVAEELVQNAISSEQPAE